LGSPFVASVAPAPDPAVTKITMCKAAAG